MNLFIISSVVAVGLLLTGCGRESANPSTAQTTASQHSSSASAAALPAMSAWERGDNAAAVTNFLAADWAVGPVFPSHSPLSLTEDRFVALSRAQQGTKSSQITHEISSLKQLAQAVAQDGREAAAKGNNTHARACFNSLKQFGVALNQPSSLQVVQLVGKGIEKMSDSELEKLPR